MAIPHIPEIHIKDLTTFKDTIILQMAEKEEEFYREVLRQILKREPTIEDAKDITLAINPKYPNQELIAYKGNTLGRIIKGYDNADFIMNTFKWTFEPIPTFKTDATI